ncbi:MAG TPA: BREX system ATP-binding domain-containing protein [Egibacteraceae bacterium]|nr:BREX system ATP-binding domain-containing protein [Egibacteraceae bacterium]
MGEQSIPIVGRERELEALDAVLSTVAAGRAQAVFLEGEPGIGKSRLLDETVRRAQERGFAILHGRAEELTRTTPFAAVGEALGWNAAGQDPVSARIAALLGADAPQLAAPGAVRDVGGQVIELVLELLHARTGDGPVLLALDDLHWADPGTLRTVRAIARRLTSLPVALVATTRPTQGTGDLQRLVDTCADEGAARLILGPLDAQALAALAGLVLGAPAGTSVTRGLAGTAGSPMFALELLKAWQREGAITVSDGAAETAGEALPETLRLAVVRRLYVLEPATLEALRLAAVLGSTFTLAGLCAMAERSASALLGCVSEAMEAGLIAEDHDQLRFRHDVIREALYEELPRTVRAALHRQAAHTLSQAGAPVVQVARHLALGAAPGDAEAIRALRQAAAHTVLLSPRLAVEFLDSARGLLQPGDAAHDELGAELILPLHLIGRTGDAERLAGDILSRRPPPRVRYLLQRGLAYALTVTGRQREAVAQYEAITAEPPAAGWTASPHAAHAIDLANLGIGLALLNEVERAREPIGRALAMAAHAHDDYAMSIALLAETTVADVEGRVHDALDSARRNVSLVTSQPAAMHGNLWAHCQLGFALLAADLLGEAAEVLRTGLRLVEEQGRVAQLSPYHIGLGSGSALAGEWDDAIAHLEAGISAGEEHVFTTLPASGALSWLHLHRGEFAAARQAVPPRDGDAPLGGFGQDWVAVAEAALLEAEGRAQPALARLRATWERQRDGGALFGFGTWRLSGTMLVRLARQTGDDAFALAVAEDAADGARRAGGVTSADAAALHCRGLADGDLTALMDAVAAYRQGPHALLAGLACEDAGTALVKAGRQKDGRQALRQALDVYRDLRARWDLDRLDATCRALGIRQVRATRRPAATTGWDSLTATEQRVTGLVAEGLSNAEVAQRLYLSRYTVETHLKHIFAKLGVGSRVELAVQAARRDASPTA